MVGTETATTAEHIFYVSNNPQLLDENGKQYFHTMTAKLLLISKRVRPNLQGAVAFLSTRVKGPNMDDYNNLGKVIKYLRGDP